MSLAAGKWIRLQPFADSSRQFRMVFINQSQSIQKNSNFLLESDESRVLLICLFFVCPAASHFTLFNNQVLVPTKEHTVLNGLALIQYIGTT